MLSLFYFLLSTTIPLLHIIVGAPGGDEASSLSVNSIDLSNCKPRSGLTQASIQATGRCYRRCIPLIRADSVVDAEGCDCVVVVVQL